jgi:hypothetical protein
MKLQVYADPNVFLSHQLVGYWKQLLIAMCNFRQYPRLWSQGETFESFVICWRRWFGSFSEASHFDQSVQTQSCCHCPYLFRTVSTVGLGGDLPTRFWPGWKQNILFQKASDYSLHQRIFRVSYGPEFYT